MYTMIIELKNHEKKYYYCNCSTIDKDTVHRQQNLNIHAIVTIVSSKN